MAHQEPTTVVWPILIRGRLITDLPSAAFFFFFVKPWITDKPWAIRSAVGGQVIQMSRRVRRESVFLMKHSPPLIPVMCRR